MIGVAGSLLRGRDASSSASTFSEAIDSLFKDTWCLKKWHADSDPAPLMLGHTTLIIRVCDVSFHPDRYRWFGFFKWLLIPTVGLDSEPLAVDSYWT